MNHVPGARHFKGRHDDVVCYHILFPSRIQPKMDEAVLKYAGHKLQTVIHSPRSTIGQIVRIRFFKCYRGNVTKLLDYVT